MPTQAIRRLSPTTRVLVLSTATYVADQHIVVRILAADFPQCIPGAKVGPLRIQRHYRHFTGVGLSTCQPFHHGIVDGVGRAVAESRLVGAQEVGILGRLRMRSLAGSGDIRAELGNLGQPHRSAYDEDAAVPVIVAAGEIALGHVQRRLLDETIHIERTCAQLGAALDIAVTGFRRGRHDAKGHQLALLGKHHRLIHGGMKGRYVLNHLIGRHDHQDGVAALLQCRMRGNRQAPARYCGQPAPASRPLLASFSSRNCSAIRKRYSSLPTSKGGCTVAPQASLTPFRRKAVACSMVQVAGKLKQLLGVLLARQRPQTGARTAAQNDGLDIHHAKVSLPSEPYQYVYRAIMRAKRPRAAFCLVHI